EERRGRRARGRAQVVERDEPRSLADQAAVQPVQELIALLLMELEMACGMERYRRGARATRPDAQRDLLGHGPAGHEDRRLLAQQRRDVAFEVVDEAPFTVAVRLFVRASLRGEVSQDRTWPLRAVAKQEALTV